MLESAMAASPVQISTAAFEVELRLFGQTTATAAELEPFGSDGRPATARRPCHRESLRQSFSVSMLPTSAPVSASRLTSLMIFRVSPVGLISKE